MTDEYCIKIQLGSVPYVRINITNTFEHPLLSFCSLVHKGKLAVKKQDDIRNGMLSLGFLEKLKGLKGGSVKS